jgi:prepilin-type N-terminal cleavage/methylation domain-containing protein
MLLLKNKKKGLSLIEVLVATSIILIFFTALVSVYNSYLRSARTNINTIKAVYLADEGIEAVKFLRDSSWSTNIAPLTSGGTYYLTFATTTWNVSNSNLFIDGVFERKFSVTNVNRDPVTFDIVSSGGAIDYDTKLVNVSVSWAVNGATTTKTVSTYITNLFAN